MIYKIKERSKTLKIFKIPKYISYNQEEEIKCIYITNNMER